MTCCSKYLAIIDPNENITLFESTSIIAYFIEKYDKERKSTYDSSPEKYQLLQWSYCQASGQGPYFGQVAWFNLFHQEKLLSAQSRYSTELHRTVGVLDHALASRDWLRGLQLYPRLIRADEDD